MPVVERSIIYAAGILWAIGVIVTTPMAYIKLGEIDKNMTMQWTGDKKAQELVHAIVDEGYTIEYIETLLTNPASNPKAYIQDDAGDKKFHVAVKERTGKHVTCGTKYNQDSHQLEEDGQNTPVAGSCFMCSEAVTLVNEAFFDMGGKNYEFNTRRSGELFRLINDHFVKIAKDDLRKDHCNAYKTKHVAEELTELGRASSELYVLEKTRVLLLVSVILFAGSVLFILGSELTNRMVSRRIDGHLLHWVYTTLIFLSFFTYLIAFAVSLSREFWHQSWHVFGVHDWEAFQHEDQLAVRDYLTAGLLFHLAAFAAHFTIKYGAIVHFGLDIEKQFEGKTAMYGAKMPSVYISSKTGQPAKTATRIQYAPLVSVARA